MTIVVGIHSLTEAIVISDSRVSWENNQYPPQDILQKIYAINGSNNKSAILGFSGDLYAANSIIRFLGKEKFFHYRRPLIMTQLRDELGRWIEEVAKQELPIKKRTRVKFMLCGIEASRHPKVLKGGKVIGHLPFVEVHVYIFSLRSDGTIYYNKVSKDFGIIGSGNKLEREILRKVQEATTFGLNQPNLHWARAVVIGEAVAAEISKNSTIFKDRGFREGAP